MGPSSDRDPADSRWPLTARARNRRRRRWRLADPARSAAFRSAVESAGWADGERGAPGRGEASTATVRQETGSLPLADVVQLRQGSLSGGPDSAAAGPDLLAEAEHFLAEFHAENPAAGSLTERIGQVRAEIAAGGTYRHTGAELTFAAQVAWRNSSRCIGRLYWRSLRVRDRRHVSSPPLVAQESFAHLREASNDGRIRPLITIFAPDAPGRPGPRILSPQVVRYAGYEQPDATVVGDPASVPITRLACKLGWQTGRPPGRFDVLPLIVQAPGAEPRCYPVPGDAVLEVPLRHPELGWFADLGLRWYAVPVISDMRLEAGGISYPAAPFNGWYMGTEIGSRDLGDAGRYNQLPEIASRMGLSTASDRTLWKDRAVTELNIAVLHSFAESGVTITDHHTESVRFLKHVEIEERHGRACPADWTWIVPPAASSTTPVFHRYYADFDAAPRFSRHPADTGCPF